MSCQDPDATHRDENCPSPTAGISRCKAVRCTQNHLQHTCKLCKTKDADHRSDECKEYTVIGYHQTDENSVKAIISSNTMLAGTKGAAGAGIYFAVDGKATDWKAHKRGYLIKANVRVGTTVFVLPHEGDTKMSKEKLASLGLKDGKAYDSIRMDRRGGTEIVIHDWKNASIISVTKIGK